MKLLSLPVSLILAATMTAGCAKKATDEASTEPTLSTISTSNKTATTLTVSWSAMVDPTTPSDQISYKLIKSTTQSWYDADSAEANGTIAMDWSVNTLTTNLTSLPHSVIVYFTLIAKNIDGVKTVVAISDVTMKCSGKKMYLVLNADGNLGGKGGADTKCNAGKPAGVTGTFAAVLMDATGTNTTSGLPNSNGRQACYGNCNSSTFYEADWTLDANTTYCTSDMEARVGYTEVGYKALQVDTANVLSPTAKKMFMGMDIYWGASYGGNCTNWSSTSGTYIAGTTSSNSGSGFVAGAVSGSCSQPGYILCAEQ